MKKHRIINALSIQYLIAMIGAPVFVLCYIYVFDHQPLELKTLFSDKQALFFLILFYPVIEEIVFRGVIQEFIASKTQKYPTILYLSVANILTSLLFVMIHFVHHTPLWALLVFVPSLIFGYFKDQYQHIAPSIFLHMFYNFWSLFIMTSIQ